MAKLGIHEIRQAALDLLRQNRGGLAKQVLIDQIRLGHPATDPGTISTQINKLAELGLAERPSHGFYVLGRTNPITTASRPPSPTARPVQFSTPEIGMSPAKFEEVALVAMSRHLGVNLRKARAGEHHKKFDFISEDGSVVGDAKFYTLVGGESLPPAKFSVIAEHVWLLEKTTAARKFLVFGNQPEVPEQWLSRYGNLVEGVEFYFLTSDGALRQLL